MKRLNADIARVNRLLPESLQLEGLAWPQAAAFHEPQPSTFSRTFSPAISEVSSRLAVAP